MQETSCPDTPVSGILSPSLTLTQSTPEANMIISSTPRRPSGASRVSKLKTPDKNRSGLLKMKAGIKLNQNKGVAAIRSIALRLRAAKGAASEPKAIAIMLEYINGAMENLVELDNYIQSMTQISASIDELVENNTKMSKKLGALDALFAETE